MNMADKIFRVEVPQKTVTQIKGGKKQEKDEKIFPGYVLVEMIMDEDSWYVVRHTAGVTKFVGSAKKPIPAGNAISILILKTVFTVFSTTLNSRFAMFQVAASSPCVMNAPAPVLILAETSYAIQLSVSPCVKGSNPSVRLA